MKPITIPNISIPTIGIPNYWDTYYRVFIYQG